MTKPLYITSRCDWTPEKIEQVYYEIQKIAFEEMELEGLVYPNAVEIITAEQMIDAYASIGLPVHYNHWSFGKDFLQTQHAYEKGHQGLAYEIVINSSPCISYLMEGNTMTMQALVIAHAAFGHNAVFKNNECFKQWTNAGSIVDYMIFARDYIRRCEERYGLDEVEEVLDAAHTLAPHGIDKFKRKHQPKMSEETHLKKLIEDEDRHQLERDIVIERTSFDTSVLTKAETDLEKEHEENLLYFLMKRAPTMPQWKREILRIVYKVNQYFYPQGMTQVLNEGFASFTHYYIMTRLEEKGILSPDAYIEFMSSHAGVLFQPPYNSRYYHGGLNPYALGFAILMDLKRICDGGHWSNNRGRRVWVPITDEDREWFPQLIGARWQDVIKAAVFEHRDDSFIMQYLSPKVMRDLKLFVVTADSKAPNAIVSEIHDEVGYRNLRMLIAQNYERINRVPQIEVVDADLEGDRTLYLRYIPYRGRSLDATSAKKVVDCIDYLWEYPVELDDQQ